MELTRAVTSAEMERAGTVRLHAEVDTYIKRVNGKNRLITREALIVEPIQKE